MKRIFNHPPAAKTGKHYWRSLEEYADTPEFRAKLEREFPQGAAELEGNEVTRRGFMQFMGASVALAGLGLTGCRRPELHIVPISKGVEWQVPGNALHYATSMPRRGGSIPLIATTYDGRPTKLEGNPNVPNSNGATDFLGQSAILDLYDPDRSKTVLKAKDRGKDYTDATFDDFWEEIAVLKHDYLKNGGQGLAILTEPITSPTRARLRAEVQKKYPKLVWAEYDAWASQSPVKLVHDFAKADVILSLDCDFLGAAEGTVQSIAGFAAGRRRLGKTQETMSRLYTVEGRFSLTGGMADHRLRVPSSNIGAFATQLATALGAGASGGFAISSDSNITTWVAGVAKDLQSAKGRSLIVCGSQQPAAVHALVHQMNVALGNDGATVKVLQSKSGQIATTTLSELTEQISEGAIKTLLVIGGNPAFDAPADIADPAESSFADALGKVEQVIRLGLYVDETSATSTTHVPAAHFLESWGDSLSYEGLYFCQQPLIMPLYNGISEIELLAELASLPKAKGAEHVQNTFLEVSGLGTIFGVPEADKQSGWHLFVHDGYLRPENTIHGDTLSGNVYEPAQGSNAPAAKPLQPGEYELNFTLGSVDDGRYANNGWLQEMPDPITKLTWDNALLVSPKTATLLKINIANVNNNLADTPDTDYGPRTSDAFEWGAIDPMTAYPMVEIETPDGRKLELPVLVAPGQHDQTLTIALGYGRTSPRITAATQFDKMVTPPLRVADGAGFNAYQLRGSATPGFVTGVKVTKLNKTWPLAITQEHNSMEGRGLVREAALTKFHDDPTFVQEVGLDVDTPHGTAKGYQNYESAYVSPPLNSKDHNPDRPAWGMVIDLNTCVGCSACVIACQAENNIPIVGKFQVLRGREMHWIRNDRYFATDNPPQGEYGTLKDNSYLDNPQMLIQPMACQQCEAAPCEPVCPVNATVHNDEGLNVMAYNRCIGTRYCANNCPYKARRFNFFNYNDRPIQNVKLPVLGVTNELYLGPFAGKDGPLTYKGAPDTIALQKNPNVSVRIRGVMEKCTYCVQRIEEAKISQLRKSNENGAGSGDIVLPTDGFKVACQQVCPAEAIVFGNMNDPNSKVTVAKADDRNYGVLAYLGTKPRTTYLGRVRNPNPDKDFPGSSTLGNTSPYLEPEKPEKKEGGDHASTNALNFEKLIG